MKKWEELPKFMQCDEVKEYYDILSKKKLSLRLKRAFDIVVATCILIITAIPMIIIAIRIATESKGGVFYRQERVTTYGKKFKIHKFRTMVANADQIGSAVTVSGDNRITSTGAFLRKYRLDELPQVFDVLSGDMSLVGTRPPTVDEWDKYELHHRARLATKPGLTGMWQVSGRSNITDFEEVVKLDKQYISEWTMGLDIRILFKTVQVVFKKEGSM